MKKVCIYCYFPNDIKDENDLKCTTCGAPLDAKRDLEKIKLGRRGKEYFGMDLDELYLPYDELVKMSFVHLYRMLKIIRQRKQETYRVDPIEYTTLRTQSFLIENIMLDKAGYFPKAIKDSEVNILEMENIMAINRHNKRMTKAMELKGENTI